MIKRIVHWSNTFLAYCIGIVMTFCSYAVADPGDQTPPPHQQHHDNIPGFPGIDQTQLDAALNIANNSTIHALMSTLPALLASISDNGDGSADPDIIEQTRRELNSTPAPDAVRSISNNALNFLYKHDPESGYFSKPYNQRVQDFALPAIARNCVHGGNIIGLGVATAGPQRTPAPGPREGETAYVVTAMGTGQPHFDSARPFKLRWINLDTHHSGVVNLMPSPLLNPNGPATFMTIVPTGHGRILTFIYGNISAKEVNSNTIFTCAVSVNGLGFIRN